MTKFISRFVKDESGATAIEYGLIAGLISIAIIAGVMLAGPQIAETFMDIAVALGAEKPI